MYYRQGLLGKLDRKFGRFAIRNLMMILVGAMGIVYVMDMMFAASMNVSLWSRLIFDRSAIMNGEVWRVVTFLFLPPSSSGIIWTIISLYFYWFVGTSLEEHWGAFGFNAYYLLGAIGAIVSGLVTGYATNTYLNLTLFLAFAILYPRYELRLFFFIPIEARWFALADIILLVWMFIESGWPQRIALIAAIINLLIFFTPHLIDHVKAIYRRIKWKRNFK
ncbi:MAG: hypothetical protein IJY93_07645 [Clostridia bacterium]|nr:hypothetical protein [Clostridia bacterium]